MRLQTMDYRKIAIFLNFLTCCVAVSVWSIDRKTYPEQIHISYGDSYSKMIVTWSTMGNVWTSIKYGTDKTNLTSRQYGTSTKFTDGGHEKRVQFIHRVDLKDLESNTKYYYVVGCDKGGWSELFSFKTMPAGSNWSPRLAIIGDMGYENAQSVAYLDAETARGMYDALIHVGDFAYDLAFDEGRLGDKYMNLVQPVVANIPYMTCVGNHEYHYNFANYKYRFNMPGDNDKRMYYSFNMGPIHFISLSTEFLYYPYLNYDLINQQYAWIKKDLSEANSPSNRTERPWIITFGHRPMYCSNDDNDDCAGPDSLIRAGVPLMGIPSLEELFLNYGVDMSIWAHEHSYERLWPVYDTKVMNGSKEEPYTNPGGITHIISGSAGCREKLEFFSKKLPAWSAFHSSDYGYTRMTVHNSTHLDVSQVSADQNGKIIDSFTLIKTRHGAYKKPSKK